MKIAYYMEDGFQQLVMTPENDIEKRMLAILDNPAEIDIRRGEFYHCQGGFVRQGPGQESRMLVMKPIKEDRN